MFIKTSINNPIGWLYSYKVDNDFRKPTETTNTSNFTLKTADAAKATKVWLMGDTSTIAVDSSNEDYPNVSNQVFPDDANDSSGHWGSTLAFNNMSADDIEDV